ncbi:tyrosine-type recombinase/integrase [Caldivirga sp. MU80]|uniref:tyrosine-type recombinase/integrase n=1 Tax=Caldivirga sp. MU80 TaxID=1650354 RepID=UPI000833A712|nr:tyrosine-type recombinase/integrase [Caldivirga sp. MU80]
MVDCELINIGNISNEERVKVINYVMENKGIRAKDLGVTINLISMIRSGKRRVTEDLLCRALSFLSTEELARLLGQVPELEPATVNDIVRVIARARADAGFRELLLSYLDRYLGEYVRSMGTRWVVAEQDVEEFVKAKRLKGLKEKTIHDHVHYLRLALSELNWTLEPEGIREFLAGLADESEEHVLRHVTVALKSFLKTVLKPKDPALFRLLYDSFTVYKPKASNRIALPSLEQLRAIWRQLPSIEAKFYFALLAETGLRPGEPFTLSISDLDLEHGMLHIGKVTETKRAFIAFLRPEFLRWVREVYLPHRVDWVERLSKGWLASGWFTPDVVEKAKQKLIPFEQSRLRREIKEAAKQVLNRDLELYELRKFYATWMISQGVPESIVNTLQGRAPPSEFRILVEHYWSPRHEELRQWYLRYAPRICCL